MAPLIQGLLGGDTTDSWMMSPAEQAAMVFLLQNSRPKVAIEIGTRFGGSLQVLARFCEKVYSLDIDPEVEARLAGKYPNVEFLIGSSRETLPQLLRKLQASQVELGFVLVDGDHSAEGVAGDLDAILQFTPNCPLYVVMHDSFNPECRRGLRQVNWARNPHVRTVELDFVSGVVNPAPSFRGQLWGGLALATLLPESRSGRFEVTGRAQATFDRVAEVPKSRSLRSMVQRLVCGSRGE